MPGTEPRFSAFDYLAISSGPNILIFNFNYVCISVGDYVHLSARALGSQKVASDPLELKLLFPSKLPDMGAGNPEFSTSTFTHSSSFYEIV